jgi:hypothetical protein
MSTIPGVLHPEQRNTDLAPLPFIHPTKKKMRAEES